MKKTQRLQTVKKLAAFREREAVIALGQARQDLTQKKARYEELQQYREEYLRTLGGIGHQGIGGQKLRAYQQFLDQLAVALQQQEKSVLLALAVVEKKQTAWLSTRQKSRIYDNIESRYLSQALLLQNQAEQKQSDEMAGQMNRVTLNNKDQN